MSPMFVINSICWSLQKMMLGTEPRGLSRRSINSIFLSSSLSFIFLFKMSAVSKSSLISFLFLENSEPLTEEKENSKDDLIKVENDYQESLSL